jgi:hypothetical protein
MFTTRSVQQGQVPLFAIEHLKNLVGALGLLPINVARMIGRLIVA